MGGGGAQKRREGKKDEGKVDKKIGGKEHRRRLKGERQEPREREREMGGEKENWRRRDGG